MPIDKLMVWLLKEKWLQIKENIAEKRAHKTIQNIHETIKQPEETTALFQQIKGSYS
jgi:hypothetical protein